MIPPPAAHILKLVIVLVIGVVAFQLLMGFLTPESWDDAGWYRQDAVAELAAKPARIAGNQSCAEGQCHETATDHQKQYDRLTDSVHENLACEGCHGPLANHVQQGLRVESARIAPTIELCLGCHAPLISKPEEFPQFDETSFSHRRKKVKASTPCKRCHDPHDPEEKPPKRASVSASPLG